MALIITPAHSHFFHHRNSLGYNVRIHSNSMSNVPYVAPDALGVTLEHIDKGPSVDDVVKMVRRATNITKLKDLVAYGNRKKLWGLCRRYLTGWAIASAPHRFSTSDLSTPQRKFKIVPSFDIRELLDSELDLVVLLACSKVGPLSRKKFSKVYIQCCTHVPLGKAIRKILQNRFDQDKFISEVVSRKTSTGPPSSG
jgi:hypothetical protein